jgi:hypothetical protein
MGRPALTLSALLFAVSIVFSSFLITQIVADLLLSNNNGYKAYGSLSDFNFAAAGDWACERTHTVNTVNGITNKAPELVLGLGDYSYEDTADCWLEIIAPLDDKMKIAIGNHEVEATQLLNQYMSHFNLTKQFYSFNYQNVHFTVISTELENGREEIEQYEFVNTDLASAASDPNIDWIVVYYHQAGYTSPWVGVNGTKVHTGLSALRDTYHPLFKKYDVDLVLQAHVHNYQRSFPIKYNNANSSSPIITDGNTTNYSNPEGQIFVTVGTGGAESYNLLAKEPYIVRQFTEEYGFLNIDVIDNGQTFNATFYSNDNGGMKDQFSITKNGSLTDDIG